MSYLMLEESSNVRYHFPPSSSELVALSTLTPPSPILKSSEMSATWTSGSIPILLFDPEKTWGNPPSVSDAITGQSVPGGLGRRCTVFDMKESIENPPPLIKMDLGISNRSRIEPLTFFDSGNQEFSGTNLELTVCGEGFLGSGCVASGNLSLQDSSAEAEFYDQETCIENIPCQHDVQEMDPASSAPLIDVNRPNLHVFGPEVNFVSLSSRIPANPNHYSRKSAAPRLLLPSPIHGRKSSPIRNIEPKLRDALPGYISNDIQIAFLIDQEGFRAAQPIFNFVGYNRKPLKQDDQAARVNYAQFRPLKRQSYHFHYAPFDGLPLLRRITVNGDDSRDYISRQAQLTLKDNGVYSVLGTEVLSELMVNPDSLDSSAFRQLEAAKLFWQFDYVVDDRLGKTMIGEKTLTPLTFSCSPGLVHPFQGKKINLMHIVRKGLASKLVAEKLEPPSRRSLQARSQSPGIIQATPLSLNWVKIDMQATRHFITKFHKRAQSQDVDQALRGIDAQGLLNKKDGEGNDIARVIRQRSSSVDEY